METAVLHPAAADSKYRRPSLPGGSQSGKHSLSEITLSVCKVNVIKCKLMRPLKLTVSMMSPTRSEHSA